MAKPFRFGVQVRQAIAAAAWRDNGPQDRGPRLLDAVHARPLRRHELAPLPAMAMAAAAHDDAAGRRARVRQRLQAPGDPRQGDRRRSTVLSRRPGRARHRRGLDEDRLRRARPAVRPAGGARRPARGGARGHQGLLRPASRSASRASTTRSPTTTRSRSRCSSRARRSSSAAAASGCCRSPAARPTSSASTRTCARARSTADAARDSLAEQTDQKIEWIREGAGDRFDDLELQIRYFVARDHRRPHGAGRGDGAGLRRSTGRRARVGRRARRHRSTRSATSCSGAARSGACRYVVVGDDNFDEFAPVVAKLAGT